MPRALIAAVLVLLAAPVGAQTPITWSTNATELRGRNGEQFTGRCPAEGLAGFIWGTDLYSDDSSICTAALHAVPGVSATDGFDVTIEIRPGASGYRGSTRNGVTSAPWGAWSGSFVVLSANGMEARQDTGKEPERVEWGTNALALRGQTGAQVSMRCPPNGRATPVYGTDVYSDDSSICSAAVHAGRIGFEDGGVVTIQLTGPRTSFTATTRNGVTSGSWGEWPGSFVFVGQN